MRRALRLAALGRLTASPNPMVGCVLVKNNIWISEGYHEKAGGPHAEVLAIKKAGSSAGGCDLYVNLEPCAHHGRTPPCVDLLIRAGIQRVFIADQDPNPSVNGKGIQRLREAGITVHQGLLQEDARQLNQVYYHFHKRRKPFVIAKWAMSLDGQQTVVKGDSLRISNEAARRHAHAWRSQVDAILIGAGTLRHDDPLLTVRDLCQAHKQPQRLVLSRNFQIPESARLFQPSEGLTCPWVVTGRKARLPKWGEHAWLRQIALPSDQQGFVKVDALLAYLAQVGMTSVLVEGGRHVVNAFFSTGHVNKVLAYVSPKVIANLPLKQALQQTVLHELEGDLCYEGDLS